MEVPHLFRCPISLELMEEPTTIATGVTYERKNIEKWLFTYKKLSCPATMQHLENFDLTPNHTLKRLIEAWKDKAQEAHTPSPLPLRCEGIEHERLVSLIEKIESSPFKVSSLKKLQSDIASSIELQADFLSSGGIHSIGRIMSQVLTKNSDFTAFEACEKALGVLDCLPLSDDASVDLVSKPECMNPIMFMLQRGNSEARVHTMSILLKISKMNHEWCNSVSDDAFKSLLELLSDEISTKLSSSTLDILIEIIKASKKNCLKAIEGGAICILIELLPQSTRHNCEKILSLIKKLCECSEGRSAFADHGLGVAAVSKKILRVSDLATKTGVKILWLVCSFIPTEKVLDDMMVFGSVRKLLGLLHIDGRNSTKDKAMKIIKMHGGLWRHYPCFPCELNQYLTLLHRPR